MKYSKYAFLILSIMFSIGFITSLFKKDIPQEIFFFEVNNIWAYRLYKLLLALVFVRAYFYQSEKR